MYSTSISRLYKLKAGIYKLLRDQDRFTENVNHSMEALMVASEYYAIQNQVRFSFLRLLTPEERFILLTKTNYFPQTARGGDDFSRESLSDAYNYLSIYHTEMGNLQASLKYSEKSIAEAQKSGNKGAIFRAYYYLGLRHLSFGFHDRAEEAFWLAKNNSYLERSGNIYWVNYHLAVCQYRSKRIKTVKDFLSQIVAQKDFLSRIGAQNTQLWPAIQGAINRQVVSIYIDSHEYDNALKVLENTSKDENIMKVVYLSRGHKFTLLEEFIKCFIAVGRFQDAETTFNEMDSLIEHLENPPIYSLRELLLKSEFLEKNGKDPLESLKGALAILEEIRPSSGNSKDYEYWENYLSVYDRLIDKFYLRSNPEQALEIAEKARSRQFLDYLGNKSLGLKSPSGSVLAVQADAIMDSLSAIEKDMVESAEAAGIKVRNVYHEGSRYSKHLMSYHRKLKEVAKTDKQYGVIKNITTVSPKEVQKKLGTDTTVIEYYLANDFLYIWIMDRDNLTLVRQNISANEIQDLVVAFRENLPANVLKRDLAVIEKGAKKIVDAPQRLYDLLFSPVKQYIHTNRICIVPYGILSYLPFQALHDGSKYLVEEYAISYVPSLSVLEYLAKGEKKENYKILAFGNPDLKDKSLDLPATEREVEEIKNIFPATEIYKREKATKVLAKKIASKFDIIHFASHGEYVQEDPLASCIRLAPENGDDGRLEANEIFDMDMKADLVVTSACQTSIGQIRRGDEVVGLTRAFLYAGASSVLGSLWSISDEATAVFMKEFYGNLKKLDKAEALRQAQVKMIRSQEYRNPFYWAAFNLTGSF
jgi:CHAT domain-containing protein